MKIRIIQTLVIFLGIILFSSNNTYATNESNDKTLSQPQKIIKIATIEYNQEEVKKTIDEASLDAKKNEEEARKSIIEADNIVKKSTSTSLIEIAKNISILEQERKDIAKLQISLAENLKKTNEDLNNIFLSLKEIELQSSDEDISNANLKKTYQEATYYWRILVDNSLKIFSQENSEFEINIPKPSNFLDKANKEIEDKAILEQYQNSYQSLQKEYENILQLKSDLNSANKNYRSNLLLKSGKLRADILQNLLSQDPNFIKYNNDYINDLFREIKLIPYRPIAIFYSKILQYKEAVSSEFVGIMYIIKQLGLIVLFVLILMVSRNTLILLTRLFNKLGQYFIKQSLTYEKYNRLAIVLPKITPYFKWIVLLIIFSFANIILESTLLSELSVLIPYLQYYFLYKIFRIFSHNSLNQLIYKNFENNKGRNTFNYKINATTKSLGVYLLSSISLLHLTQTIVRNAYFYNLTLNLFLFGLLIITALIASDWKDEIQEISLKKLSKRFNKIIKILLIDKRRSFLFSLPILCILITKEIINRILAILQNHDFFKNILSQIYRKKLESAAKRVELTQTTKTKHSSKTYVKEFSKTNDNEKFIPIKNHPYQEIKDIISNWESNKSEENSVAIYSERGIGKTRFIDKIINDNKGKDLKIIKTSIDKKITDKKDFLAIISTIFNEKINEKDLFKFLSSHNQKTIIILDDCHNLFIAKEDGFEALKTFFNFLVKVNNPNLLWITTFNYYSWHYLQNALKIGNYFRYTLKLPRWSDKNIRELIINKHDETNFKLSYDPLIFSIETHRSEKEFEDLQLKFFQIIWSQSRGNPKIALTLWLSSLSSKNSTTIRISIPKIFKSDHLYTLSDEHLFVYGAIVKHQNLSVNELTNILCVPKEEVLNIIRIGLEKGYLMESTTNNKLFNISYDWQIAINQLLINRNFIYAE